MGPKLAMYFSSCVYISVYSCVKRLARYHL